MKWNGGRAAKRYWASWRAHAAEAKAERRAAKSPKYTHCQNCQTELKGAYCYNCGQAAKEPRRAVIGLVQDVFVETLAIDGKLFRTIWLLLRAPGKLARRFLDGQRMRYSPPFRLYLFASVFFFLAAFWSVGQNLQFTNGNDDDLVTVEVTEGAEAEDDAPAEDTAPPEEEEAADPQAQEAVDLAISEAIEGSGYETDVEWLKPYMEDLTDAVERLQEDPRLFMAQLRENLPRFLLLAPVVYALTLMLLYIYRRRFFVYDHFVVSLYMHAALYAYLLIAVLVSKIPVVGGLFWVVLIWGALQPILVQRQAYGSNWFSVIIKWAVANTIYWIAMGIIVALGFGYSLLQS